jgi:hypothetical protein
MVLNRLLIISNRLPITASSGLSLKKYRLDRIQGVRTSSYASHGIAAGIDRVVGLLSGCSSERRNRGRGAHLATATVRAAGAVLSYLAARTVEGVS